METFLIKTLQLLLSLSILVLVHEFGHFLFARVFKVRVEKFYLFFDPWFSIFKIKPKNSDTEYGLGWLPLGGYCKISGMIDESMDKEQMAQPAQPYEFRSKPAGQRLMIMIGGVLFNFILALFIYSMVLFTWGDNFLPLKNVTQGMDFSETFQNIGFKDGDILLKADDKEFGRFGQDALRMVANAKTVTVIRDNSEVVISIPEDVMQRVMRDNKGFAAIRVPAVINELVSKESPAALAGLQKGDRLISIDGMKISSAYDLEGILKDKQQKEISVVYERQGVEQRTLLTTDSNAKMGVQLELNPNKIYKTIANTYGFFESFPAGIELGVNTLKGYVGDMKYVFTKEGASSLGGFATIGSLFPAEWNWYEFWMKTAFLSIILAFMNILPIPALDGGHVMFLLYEVIARRKPSDKFMEYAQITGMILLFSLLLFANGNDIFRFFFK